MTIFLLGPDQWDDGVTEPWPAWAAHADAKRAFTPKDFRFEIKHAIERDSRGRVKAVVMDDSLKPKGKDIKDDELFHHIETTFHVTRYFIIIPSRTKVLGTKASARSTSRVSPPGRTTWTHGARSRSAWNSPLSKRSRRGPCRARPLIQRVTKEEAGSRPGSPASPRGPPRSAGVCEAPREGPCAADG